MLHKEVVFFRKLRKSMRDPVYDVILHQRLQQMAGFRKDIIEIV